MKQPKRAAFLPIFSVFLVLGFVLGSFANRESSLARSANAPVRVAITPSLPVTQSLPTNVSTAPNGQRNLLLIGVDRLDGGDPHLESIWLMIYLPYMPRVTLAPIFPAALEGGLAQDAYLDHVFRFQPNGSLDPAFFSALQEIEVWWHNYIILDRVGLQDVIDQVGGIEVEGQFLDGKRVLARLPTPSQDPKLSARAQVTILRDLCRQHNRLSADLDPNRLLDSLSSHVYTDMTLEQILNEWQNLGASVGNLTCEFPTLTSSEPSGSK